MPDATGLILGEYPRTLDERFRLSVPTPLLDALDLQGADCILAKERPGSLSLWNAAKWSPRLEQELDWVRAKIEGGRLEGRIEDVQRLGRLLSTRQRTVQLAGRGRLVIPEGFREFLGVDPGDEVLVVGAALCVEIWRVAKWLEYLEENMVEFRRLMDNLSA